VSELDELGGWPALLARLLDGTDLTAAEARTAMATILANQATAAQMVAFVVALRAKGETGEELSGLLDAVLDAATLVTLDPELRDRCIDIVGTGGDRSHSINVSTMAAIVAAGAGVPVCKHGGRAASSQCGTADVLQELGVEIDLGPDGIRACVEQAGMAFCFAPNFHPAFRFAAPHRREIGIPTVFNLLGPMANPARVRRSVIGVANPTVAARMLASLRVHGSARAWIVHGNGLDELTTTGTSTVVSLDGDEVHTFDVDPVDLGLAPALPEELTGGDRAHNADVVRRVLDGEHGPARDIVLLNAAAGLVVGGAASDLPEGLVRAAESIDSGAAKAALARLVEVSRAQARPS
jgi:anthranilate phosphoribosyltransferase